jgi:hypothetical protein
MRRPWKGGLQTGLYHDRVCHGFSYKTSLSSCFFAWVCLPVFSLSPATLLDLSASRRCFRALLSSPLNMPSTPFTSVPVTKIILPDLVSHCKFDIRINRHRKQITSETKRWLFKGDNLVGKRRDAFHGLKAGLLSAMCYPDAGCPQLRVVNDFLTYLFHLDNLSDDMDNRGTRATADVVLDSLYHPHTYRSPARVGRMAREYVNVAFTSFIHNKPI